MPRKFRPKTGAERARKFRRRRALVREIRMLSEMLESHGGIHPTEQVRYELNRLLQDRHRQLDRLLGRSNRRSKPNSHRLSSSESTVRSAGSVSKQTMNGLAEDGFDFTIGFQIGTLNGAGSVPKDSPRLQTPPWLLDKQRVNKLFRHFQKTRMRTAKLDIALLSGYYLDRCSNAALYRLLTPWLDQNGNRIFRLKVDKEGGYKNLERYRQRLVEIGYKFFGLQKPNWKEIKAEREGARTGGYGTGANPIAFLRGERDVRERNQGSVEEEAQRTVNYLEQALKRQLIEPVNRVEMLEEDRQELPAELQEADRRIQRQLDLAHEGRITALYKEFLLGGPRGTRNGQNSKSPLKMRPEVELSGNVAIHEGKGVLESPGTSPLADAQQAA